MSRRSYAPQVFGDWSQLPYYELRNREQSNALVGWNLAFVQVLHPCGAPLAQFVEPVRVTTALNDDGEIVDLDVFPQRPVWQPVTGDDTGQIPEITSDVTYLVRWTGLDEYGQEVAGAEIEWPLRHRGGGLAWPERGLGSVVEIAADRYRVSCDNVPDADVDLRVTGTGAAGTVVIAPGDEGTTYVGDLPGAFVTDMLDAYRDAGLLVVELAWRDDGVWAVPLDFDRGTLTVASRFATLSAWIRENLHVGGVFVAQGNSAGGTQVLAAALHYGQAYDAIVATNFPPAPLAKGGILNDTDAEQLVLGGLEPLLAEDPAYDLAPCSVHLLYGENEPSEAIRNCVAALYARLTSTASLDEVAGTAHQIYATAAGVDAVTEAVLSAL